MNNPEYAKVGDKLYKINTDFKIALECDKIVRSDILEQEKSLAVIYLLYGEEGLKNQKDWQKLIEKASIYLQGGKEPSTTTEKPNMDFEQDKNYIKASFFTDYGIQNVYNTNMHWWDFCDYLNGLTENCVLNRVRFTRDYDISNLKGKELEEWIKRKKEVELKKGEKKATKEQQKASDDFYKQIGL